MAKQLVIIVSLALISGAVNAADEGVASDGNAGRKLLDQCARKIKQVRLVRYEADYKGTAWVAKRVAEVKGKVVLGGRSQWDLDEFRCDVALKAPDSEEVINLTAGSDGELFYLIVPKTKMVYADIDPAVLGSHNRNLRRVIFRDFTSEQPLQEILKAQKIELQGTELVGREPCHKIEVVTEDGSRSIWFISQKDHLPRRLVRYHNHPEHGEGTTELTLHGVEIDPRLDRSPFTLTVPAGFTKTDDFAP